MRASDFSTSLLHADNVMVPSGDLQLMTFIAAGVVRSMAIAPASWPRTSSCMKRPRFTIDVSPGSDADHRNPGWVNMPARPWAAGHSALTKVVLLLGAPPPGKVSPGNSVARRLFTHTLCELTRSSTVPDGLVQNTSFTNFFL